MIRLGFIFVLTLFFSVDQAGVVASDGLGLRFYIQIIRGNNQGAPPTDTAKPAGPKLSRKLHSVFAWSNYWELRQCTALVPLGEKVRTRLFATRDIEIELTQPHNVVIRIFRNGRLVSSRKQPVENAFFVTGGDEGVAQSWFVVVRRDPPLPPVKL